jgi:hypothetical protein
MTDNLLQKIATIIHGYYQARGIGLEKTCKEVLACVESESDNILNSTNLFLLSRTGLDNLQLKRDDRLLAWEKNRLHLYDSETIGAYIFPTLNQAKWKLSDDAFALPDTSIIDLLDRGAVVYLLRSAC